MDIDPISRLSMACPALPLCGLAISEAERGLPDINRRIRTMLTGLGFDEAEQFHVRMTGCPNGCSRPYMAELGFVGDGPNSYQLWLGGTPAQTRMAEPFQERMKVQVSAEQELFDFRICRICYSVGMTLLAWVDPYIHQAVRDALSR